MATVNQNVSCDQIVKKDLDKYKQHKLQTKREQPVVLMHVVKKSF